MKQFIFDEIIDRENICNMTNYADEIISAALKSHNLVVYGRRNFGKTSLFKEIIIPDFKKAVKKSFTLYVDLYLIKDESHAAEVILSALKRSISAHFPTKALLKNVSSLFSSINPTLAINPDSGSMELSLAHQSQNSPTLGFFEIFDVLKKLAKTHQILLVFDEFQAISRIDKFDALLRSYFQELKNTSIVLMGSHKHMLMDILANPAKPLANFGSDIEIGPIPFAEYNDYILERFQIHNITITKEVMIFIQTLMDRVPEAINIVSYKLLYFALNNGLTKVDKIEYCQTIVNKLVNSKATRFNSLIISLTKHEQNLLLAISTNQPVKHPSAKAFTDNLTSSRSNIDHMLKKLLTLNHIEQSEVGYKISDPLMARYLRTLA
jgi:hypothetical protein